MLRTKFSLSCDPSRPAHAARPDSTPDRIREAIDGCDLISWEIDALLFRTVLNRDTVFHLVEKISRAEGFARAREEARRRARRRNPACSLAQIYAEMPPRFRGLEALEAQLEAKLLLPDEEMLSLWKYALEKGKRLIIVCDSCRSSETLGGLLISKGFSGFEKIYVSCECGTEKKEGLFQRVLEEEHVEPRNMLHFGTKFRRSGPLPAAPELNICRVLTPLDQLAARPEWKRFRRYWRNDHFYSIVLGLFAALRTEEEFLSDPWFLFGALLGGPLAIGFAEYCMQLARGKEIRHLLFLARDGWLVKKAVETLAQPGEFSCHYVYAPRAYSYLLAYSREDLKKHGLDRFLDMLDECGAEQPPGERARMTAGQKRAFILKNWDRLDPLRSKAEKMFRQYVASLRRRTEPGPVMLIDGVSGQGSAEKLFRKFWKELSVTAYCSYAGERDPGCFSYCEGTEMTVPLSFFELFLAAPTPPVTGITDKGEPVYRHTAQHDAVILSFKRLERGFDAFLRAYARQLGTFSGLFPASRVLELFGLLADTLTDGEMGELEKGILPADSAEHRFRTISEKVYPPVLRIGRNFKLLVRKTKYSFVVRCAVGKSHRTLLRYMRLRKELESPQAGVV